MIDKELQKYMPSVCPACGEPLTFDGIHLMCNNKNCEGRIARKLGAAVGVLDLKGIGGKTIEPFAQDFYNMYDLMVWVLKNQNNINMLKYGIPMGSRSEEIFVNAFKNIKSLKYSQVILIQGYDGIGRKVSEQAAREYCGLTPDYASIEKALVRKLQEPEIVSNIKYFVSELESLGITIDKPEDKKEVAGTIYVCMTGSPKAFGFKTKEEFITKFPNLVEVSVTDKNCNFLITDDLNSTSSKMKAAEKKGVKIVTYGTYKN
jgi:NAD-dependent DNA ligase